MPVKSILLLLGTLLSWGLIVESSISSADARSYYTRKRVNGVWITGYFERKRPAQSERKQSEASVAPVDTPPRPSTTADLAADDRHPPAFQHAPEARRAAITAAFSDPTPHDPGLIPLRQALEARAKIMATAGASAASPGRAVRSMTVDFESRVTSIQFLDGSRAEEPWDPVATGALRVNAVPAN